MKTGTKILISAFATMIAVCFSYVSHLVLLPLLALGAFMAVEWGFLYLVPILAAVAVPILLRPIGAGELAMLAELMAIPLLLALFSKKRLPHRYTLITLAAVICLGEYLSLTLGSMLAGKAPHEGAVQVWEAAVETFGSALGANGAEAASSLREFSAIIPDILMWACVMCGEVLSFLLLITYRLWSKVFRVEPRPMADITEWRLPKSMLWGSLLMGGFIILVYALKLNGANAIAYSLGLIISSLFAVQGVSTLLFLFKVAGAPKAFPIVLYVIILISFPWSMGVLAVIGVMEHIRNRRGKIKRIMAERQARRDAESIMDEYEKYGYIRREPEGSEGPRDKESNNDDSVKED